mmetsp:Transcript_14603/g.21770  ORF Transcript_14603/g.21770 Transcript_14603/m.21770 type:complete len:550 (+) Transcript_14603:482-2131(+)
MKSNMKPNMKPRSKFFPQTIVTPKEAARRVAAARAYALGDTTAQTQPQTQHIVSGTNGKVASSGTKTGTSTGTGVGVTGTAIAPPLLAGTGTHSSRSSVPASKLTSRPLPTSGNNNNNKLGSPLTKTKGPQQMIQNQYEAARSLAEQFPSGNGNGNSGDPNHDPDTVGKLGMGNTTTNINAVGSVRYSLPTMGAGGLGLGQQHHQQSSQLGHGHVHVHGSVVRPPSRIAQSYRLMEIDDEEYAKFVRSLWIDDEIEDDEEDYCEGDDDEDDGDEDDDDNDDNEGDSEKDKEEDGEKDTPSGDIGDASAAAAALPGTPASKSTFVGLSEKNKKDPLGLDDLDFDLFDPLQLEEELGGLLEEDMEAAVSSLIMQDSMGMGMGMGMQSYVQMQSGMPMQMQMRPSLKREREPPAEPNIQRLPSIDANVPLEMDDFQTPMGMGMGMEHDDNDTYGYQDNYQQRYSRRLEALSTVSIDDNDYQYTGGECDSQSQSSVEFGSGNGYTNEIGGNGKEDYQNFNQLLGSLHKARRAAHQARRDVGQLRQREHEHEHE